MAVTVISCRLMHGCVQAGCIGQPQGNTDMKTVTLSICSALIAVAALGGSAQLTPAAAGSLDWLGNDNYVRCLKYVSALSRGDAAAYDRGRRTCNRQYYPGRPGYDY
jgi:hypothetical protein